MLPYLVLTSSMYTLNFLNKENDLTKILRGYKKEKSSFSILFVSLWDDYSTRLVEGLSKKYSTTETGEELFIVDSFQMPHSFVIYKTTKVPHLVQVRPKYTISEDYLPNIFSKLHIN